MGGEEKEGVKGGRGSEGRGSERKGAVRLCVFLRVFARMYTCSGEEEEEEEVQYLTMFNKVLL